MGSLPPRPARRQVPSARCGAAWLRSEAHPLHVHTPHTQAPWFLIWREKLQCRDPDALGVPQS